MPASPSPSPLKVKEKKVKTKAKAKPIEDADESNNKGPSSNKGPTKYKEKNNAAPVSLDVGKDYIPFWAEDPNVLMRSYELFPANDRTTNQNLNAVTRFVILLTIFFYVLNRRLTVLLMFIVTLFFIYLYHYVYFGKNKKPVDESFENPNTDALSLEALKAYQQTLFDTPTLVNPFGNVLNGDILLNPKKRPAPAIDDPEVQDEIFEMAKQAMIANNPTFPDIDKRLLQNMGDVFQFEQSLQPFYTNPATTVPNDQNSFADFCYGSMISCKEGNLFACAKNSDEAVHYNKY